NAPATPNNRANALKSGSREPKRGIKKLCILFRRITNFNRGKKSDKYSETEHPTRIKKKRKNIQKKSAKLYFKGIFRDVLISSVIVLSILSGLYLYSGVWPPMVVIESSSMMHDKDSQIGIIDTGDLTLVKKINDRKDIVTYIEATCKTSSKYGYKAYGDFGDVIIYKKNGLYETPVIHRAIVWIEFNTTASCITNNDFRADIPDLKIFNVKQYTIKNQGYRKEDLIISFQIIFSSMKSSGEYHGGFLTKGDHNLQKVDQESLRVGGAFVKPVKTEWVVGKSEGELPWFGLFKLWVTGHNVDTFPDSSVRNLIITIFLLIFIPIIVDFGISYWRKRNKMRIKLRKKP
ncbi:MAG: S26 family signal peptidase, partial [Thermoplasmatota archaeon]